MAKHLTNTQFVKRLMEDSAFGPLAQIFVMDALLQRSDIVAAADPNDPVFNNSFMSGPAWIGVAKEIKEKLAAHLA